jgi:putative transposase
MITIRNLVKPSHNNYKNIKRACQNTSAIFNCANYIMRQSFFDGDMRKWNSVDKQLKNLNPLYQNNPSAGSQTTIKRLGENWESFRKSVKEFKKNPSKYKKRPKPPAYSKNLKTYIQPAQGLKILDGYIHFPKILELEPMQFLNIEDKKSGKNGKASEIRFVPHGHCFWVEVIYDDVKDVENKQKDIKLNKENHIAIDLGIDNLLTIISNVDTLKPILIKGKIIKSINQQYNKQKAFFQSQNNKAMVDKIGVKRYLKMQDYMHKSSNKVIQHCLKNDIGTIVIGKNDNWKDEINIGRVNNQKFVSIPFQSLIKKIEYKAEKLGIEVILQEESYTSKSDALALDNLPKYKKGNKKKHVFLGKRKKRGLYQSSIGKLINADVNGAINILRKVISDGFVKNLVNKGLVFNPEVIALQ